MATQVYRNPEEIRALSNVLVLIQPFLYGPYFMHVLETTNLPYVLILSLFTALITAGLLTISRICEDPFNERHTDGVRVTAVFREIDYSLHSTLEGAAQWIAGEIDVSGVEMVHGDARELGPSHDVYRPLCSHYDTGR